MLRTLVGAMAGRAINSSARGGGLKGAVIGAVAARAITRMGPIGLLLGGAYLAKRAYDSRRQV